MRFAPQILLVENRGETGILRQQLAQDPGIACVLVHTGEDALEKLRAGTFDLVIADHALAGMSGLDLLREVKRAWQELDVILMTDSADMQGLLQALEAGVYDYLLKPFASTADVSKKIVRALDKRRVVLENRHLIRYLSQANAQIEDMNRALEAQVIERTQQLQEANQHLEQLTLTDDVTGLYNQRFLHSRLEEEFQRARRYATSLGVVMLDLDKFKHVNDSHDHLFGSRVLRRVGQLLLQAVRDTDMVIRYGGDEFVILLPHTAMVDAIRIAERIRRAVAEGDVGDSSDVWHISASVGVAALDLCPTETGRALMRAADLALYCAKAAGRNQVQAAPATPMVGVA